MSSKFFKFGLMAVLAIGLAACDDDSDNNKGGNNGGNDTPAPSIVCTEGVSECDGNNLKRCVNNSWQSTPCSDGCDAAAKQCIVPAGVTPKCTENDKRCNGDNLETCISNDWHSDKCDNGCDASAKQCKAPSKPEPGTSCTAGEKKCDGNYVSTCSGGDWQKNKSECPYGCENGACKKQGETPSTGSDDSYCEGEVLHYKDSDGKDATMDCSEYKDNGVVCQKLKDGRSDCVFSHETVSKACTAENVIIPGECMKGSELNIPDAELPFLVSTRCSYNSKNELVGVSEISISTCGKYQNQTAAFLCETQADGSYKPVYAPCSTCDGSKIVAVCDGKEIYDGSGSEVADEYVVCDDKCKVDDSTTCLASCKAKGKNYCYVNYATSKFGCYETEQDPSKIGDDEYDPFDLMDCDDYGCALDDNTECSSKCDKYCYVSLSKKNYFCSDEELTAVGHDYWYCGDKEMSDSSGKKDLLDNLCAAESANTIGICDGVNPGCLEKCSSKGGTQAACLDSDSMSASYNLVCSDIDGKLAYTPDLKSLSKCASTCNEAGDACK